MKMVVLLGILLLLTGCETYHHGQNDNFNRMKTAPSLEWIDALQRNQRISERSPASGIPQTPPSNPGNGNGHEGGNSGVGHGNGGSSGNPGQGNGPKK